MSKELHLGVNCQVERGGRREEQENLDNLVKASAITKKFGFCVFYGVKRDRKQGR